MGNIFISAATGSDTANISELITFSTSEAMDDSGGIQGLDENVDEEFHDTTEGDNYEEARSKRKEEELSEFKKQLNVKREQRRKILARHKAEKKNLEETLIEERNFKLELLNQNRLLKDLILENNIEIPENCKSSREYEEFLRIVDQMREEVDLLKSNNRSLKFDLATTNKTLQEANSDIAELSVQNTESIKHINALKEVISVSKTMISLRENQLVELKNKLNEIEQSLADREASMLSTDLRQEYERQLQNIRTLRGLYEERARLAEVTKQALVRELDEHKLLLQAEVKKNEELNARVQDLETNVNKLNDIVEEKNSAIWTCKEDCRGLQSEMAVVNKLFSQVLLGYKSKNYLDNLVTRLEENHGILTHMAEKENESDVSSALPKLLLELVSQIEEKDTSGTKTLQQTGVEGSSVADVIDAGIEIGSVSTPEEIVQNLPKVWRVLMELLSHQIEAETNHTEKVTTCYKPVQTKSGTVLVPSVSQTYIRLKELILEKLALIKEVNRMKQLNTHLESRLQNQEKRLCSVTNELGKTWHVVGRLRRHHQQLHTHEKILKYELQQKRKLLNELKEELKYCREKWEQAREKNSQSEEDWKKLRTEFTNRKIIDSNLLNNSAESGYSDERPSDESSDSSDESLHNIEAKLKYKKKIIKTFDAVLDTSTCVNLAADPLEDPVSDMSDVADLSLNTQDDNAEPLEQCHLYNDMNIYRSDRNTETENDGQHISQDVSNNNTFVSTHSELSGHSKCDSIVTAKPCSYNDNNESSSSTSKVIDLETRNAQKCIQNENLEEFNEKLDGQTQSIASLNNIKSVSNLSYTINNTSDNLYNSTCSTSVTIQEAGGIYPDKITLDSAPDTLESTDSNEDGNKVFTICNIDADNDKDNTPKVQACVSKDLQQVSEIDFKAILENVRRQDENLRRKEKRLENLEQACSSVVSDLTSTLNSGDFIISKLNTLHSEHNKDINVNSDGSAPTASQNQCAADPEPSTSNDIDHKARFAARDLRLKRLEEQTKSLVNKVNKTATKGVKIHYKLEELQNIYGTDTSRSGTPSEDTEDTSQNTDDGSQEEEI